MRKKYTIKLDIKSQRSEVSVKLDRFKKIRWYDEIVNG